MERQLCNTAIQIETGTISTNKRSVRGKIADALSNAQNKHGKQGENEKETEIECGKTHNVVFAFFGIVAGVFAEGNQRSE